MEIITYLQFMGVALISYWLGYKAFGLYLKKFINQNTDQVLIKELRQFAQKKGASL